MKILLFIGTAILFGLIYEIFSYFVVIILGRFVKRIEKYKNNKNINKNRIIYEPKDEKPYKNTVIGFHK